MYSTSNGEESLEGVEDLSASEHKDGNETTSLETESIEDDEEATIETSHASHSERYLVGRKDTKVKKDADKPRDLYRGLTGWIELEESRPLPLCTLRKPPVVVSKLISRSSEKEKKTLKDKAARTRIHRSLPTSARKVNRRTVTTNNKKSTSVVINNNNIRASPRSIISNNSSKDPVKIPKKRVSSPKVPFSSLAREKAHKAMHNPDKAFTITETTLDDVLLGRGNNLVTFSGNVKFRETVLKHRTEYLASKRVEKGIIAQRVIDTVWSRGGRFLEFDGKNKWRETNMTRIMEKTTQALREKHAWKEHPGSRK